MKVNDFYLSLREEILNLITGIENSNGWLGRWDNTTPNSVIKSRLKKLLNEYVLLAAKFDVYVVTRFVSCNNKKHAMDTIFNRYGFHIDYNDDDYIWNGFRIYEGPRLSVCPCSLKNKEHKNYVIDEIIYSSTADIKNSETIAHTLESISNAIQQSGNNRPRSGIREHLLLVLLILNDALLPKPMNEYISEIKNNK